MRTYSILGKITPPTISIPSDICAARATFAQSHHPISVVQEIISGRFRNREGGLTVFKSGTKHLCSLLRLLVLLTAFGAMACNTGRGQIADAASKSPSAATQGSETAVFAAGCFWGVDAVFKHVKGVTSVVSGYSGGSAATAHYEVVSTGITGHAESVKITYDPSEISYSQLLRIFFSVAHDPTELNRQGPDTGTQYRSAIFYASEDQKQTALATIDQLNKAKVFSAPIVTQVTPLKAFYPAEEYHQNFLARHPAYPYIVYNDLPKLRRLQAQFPAFYKQ